MEQYTTMEADLDLVRAKETISNHEDVKDFKITTMTVCVMLDSLVNLATICDKGHYCGFYNSVLIRKNKVAIKVFSNGNLHMTGVSSVKCALETAEQVCEILGKNHKVIDYQIMLINCCFRYALEDKIVSLHNFYKCLLRDSKYFCVLNSDTHAGLRIKVNYGPELHTSSIIVFQNGNVLVNAFVSGDELIHAFTYLSDCFKKYGHDILQQKGESTHSKRRKGEFDYSQFLVLK